MNPFMPSPFINKTLLQLTDNESAAFRSEVISRIPELFDLNREGTFVLVIDHFTSEEGSHILSELRSHPKSLFLHLKTVIEAHLSGTLNFSSLRKDDLVRVKDQSKAVEAYLERICDFPKLLRNNPVNVTDDMIELYLEFEMLTNLQRDRGLVEIENMPQLRLAPPAVYHEKVQKGTVLSPAESSSDLARIEKQSKTKQLRELKVKGPSLRFPLKSNIFGNGKEKTSKR